jgi:hypothetical protein
MIPQVYAHACACARMCMCVWGEWLEGSEHMHLDNSVTGHNTESTYARTYVHMYIFTSGI